MTRDKWPVAICSRLFLFHYTHAMPSHVGKVPNECEAEEECGRQ